LLGIRSPTAGGPNRLAEARGRRVVMKTDPEWSSSIGRARPRALKPQLPSSPMIRAVAAGRKAKLIARARGRASLTSRTFDVVCSKRGVVGFEANTGSTTHGRTARGEDEVRAPASSVRTTRESAAKPPTPPWPPTAPAPGERRAGRNEARGTRRPRSCDRVVERPWRRQTRRRNAMHISPDSSPLRRPG